MRIGIDARFLTHPQRGGFKSYTGSLIHALAKVDSTNSYTLFLDRNPDSDTNLPEQPNFDYRVIHGEYPILGMPWREQVRIPHYAEKDQLDIFHAPCSTAPLRLKCASVVTIHDLIWFSSRYSLNRRTPLKRRLMDWYYYRIPQLVTSRCSLVLTVSQASKSKIVKQLRVPAEKVVVTYEGASPIFHVVRDIHQLNNVREKYGLSSNYLMAIGSTDPRKNISTLLRAYKLLPENLMNTHQLAIIWTHPFMMNILQKEVEELGLNERVCFLNQVNDNDLLMLYNAASIFVFPSLEEGFGLPLLESMACGTPVVAGENSSIPEIVDDAGVLVDTTDPKDIAMGIIRVLTDPDLKADLIRKGLRRSTDFSWEDCANRTIEAYAQAYSTRFGCG